MKLSIPHINHSDTQSLKSVMKSGWISTSAKIVNEFEKKLSYFCKTKYSIALNSGTSAIHLGLKILGVNKNCEVIVPSITFIATVNPILYLGAKPIIFDVDQYHNLKISDVIQFIKNKTIFKNKRTINKKTKKEIKAIIVAHMWGRACDFSELTKLCKKRNIYIIEDAAEALGSYVNTKRKKLKHCGGMGDIGCLSFNANKIITTGSGGAIITSNRNLYLKAQYLANQAKDDTFNYIHNECGYNYKMNGMAAALGISQLKQYVSSCYLNSNCLLFGIFCGSQHVGNIKYEPIDLKTSICAVGLMIGNSNFRGIGLAAKSLALGNSTVASKYGIKTIELRVYSWNIRAINAYKKAGFVIVDTASLIEPHPDGTIMSLTVH